MPFMRDPPGGSYPEGPRPSTPRDPAATTLATCGKHARGSGRAVTGGSSSSYEGGGGPVERGSWRAGVLFLAGTERAEWGRRVGRYGATEDGRTMLITYDRGGRKLGTRQ